MSNELLRLLSLAGVPGEIGWADLIVVQNRPRYSSFNVIVLARGVPEYFAKFRKRGDTLLSWETQVRTCLAQVSEGVSVPPARGVTAGRRTIQVSPFIRGAPLGRVVSRQSTAEYLGVLRRVLHGVRQLGEHAGASCPSLRIDEPSINLGRLAAEALDYVVAHGALDKALASALREALSSAGKLTARHQHGDLWHQNILIQDGHIWVIDLEHYSTVRCPLYDDLTLMASTLSRRPGASRDGIRCLMGTDPDAAGCREILFANGRTDGVDPQQLDGILAYYVIHRASMIHMRAGSAHWGVPFDDVRYVAESLACGERGLLNV